MSSPLPSMNALRAFEATARLRSMTAAARELCVTHGAISRHIKSLEETLGVSLLHRGTKSTDPTPEGMRLAEGLMTAFNLIRVSVEQLKPAPITLSCSASIMMYWLIPRLPQFTRVNQKTEIQYNINFGPVDFMNDKISIAIRNSTIPAPRNSVVREIADEWIGPVCSPEYLARASIASMSDLAATHLLGVKTRPTAWTDWQAARGLAGPELASSTVFEHFYLQIQAAACGLGVALVPRMLVMDDILAGKLVAPFGFVPGPRRLVLWIAPHLAQRPDMRLLEAWLTAEMGKCVGPEVGRDAPETGVSGLLDRPQFLI